MAPHRRCPGAASLAADAAFSHVIGEGSAAATTLLAIANRAAQNRLI